jgi:Farnesoic acid 0-methyl transferase
VYKYLAFKVRTCNDAHVLLSSSLDMSGLTTYEVVLGGYDNMYSDVRRGSQGSIVGQAYTPNIMNCDELLPVWIRWEGQILEVGVGPLGAHAIIRVEEPAVSTIQSASVTSWYTASGEYQFPESQGNYLHISSVPDLIQHV